MSMQPSRPTGLFSFKDSSLKRTQEARDQSPHRLNTSTSKRTRVSDDGNEAANRSTQRSFAQQARSSASTPLPEFDSRSRNERHSSSLVDSDSENETANKALDPARRRASSSLVSDRTDGEPYRPSKSGSPEPKKPATARKQSDSLFVSSSPQQLPKGTKPIQKPSMDRSIGSRSSAAPLANMNPAFHISSPDPASVRPFPAPESAVVTSSFKNSLSEDARKRIDTLRKDTVPMEDVRTTPILGGNDDQKDEKTAFYQIYGKLCKASQDQVGLFEQLHDEHQKDLKRTQNLASRRKQRVEQLERENAAIRREISSGQAGNNTNFDYEKKLASMASTIEMLTSDLNSWETKYQNSQQALRNTTDDAQTFERKYNDAQRAVTGLTSQLNDVKEEFDEAKEGIRSGTKQLKALQRVMRSVDKNIILKVKGLAKSSAEWDRTGGKDERLRVRVAGEMTELVNAWRKFEGEYEDFDGVGGAAGGREGTTAP